MKNIFKYIGIAAMGCVAFTSCSDDEFLTVTHYSLLDEDAMFATDQNAVSTANPTADQSAGNTAVVTNNNQGGQQS